MRRAGKHQRALLPWRGSAFLAALLLALSVLSGCAGERSSETRGGEWHYLQFDTEQRAVYDAFRKACDDPFSEEPVGIVDESGESVRVSVRDADTVYQGFLYDHPELFWLDQTYRYRLSGEEDETAYTDAVAVISVAASYKDQKQMQKEFEAAKRQMLSGIPDRGHDGERAFTIYQRLTEGADYKEETLYDPSMKSGHTAYGAVVNRGAVCDGFALACKYLLNAKGIECILIPGTSSGQAHVWVTAMWDGKWHEADPTRDVCAEEGEKGQFFDLTTEEMNKDHAREESILTKAVPIAEDR